MTTTKRISTVFMKRTDSIDLIFSSYRTLFEQYNAALRTANINENNRVAFERCKKTVEDIQEDISSKLYTQALVLLTGAAEALLKDVFEDLIQENFVSIKKANGINFSISDIQKIIEENEESDYISLSLANLTIKQINETRNKNEKINFQNIQTMRQVFFDYFDIVINTESDECKYLHKSWQRRHAILHTNSIVDERYKHNVEFIGLESEEIGDTVTISKIEYDETKKKFISLFDEIESLVKIKNLTIDHVA